MQQNIQKEFDICITIYRKILIFATQYAEKILIFATQYIERF